MDELKNQLKRLVEKYAKKMPSEVYNDLKPIEKKQLPEIESEVIALFTQFLLQNGKINEAIDKQYKKLCLLIHTDKIQQFIPEVRWLEAQLSEQRNDGALFKISQFCVEKLKAFNKMPPQDKPLNSMQEFRELIQKKRNSTSLWTEKNLYSSILDLIDKMESYDKSIKQIDNATIQALLKGMPWLTSIMCFNVFIKEIALLYAIGYLAGKTGHFMQQSGNQDWQQLGLITCSMSKNLSTIVTSVLCKLSSLNFQVARQICDSGLYLNERLYKILAQAEEKPDSSAIVVQDFFFKDGLKTVELKLAMQPLEARLERLANQTLGYYRTGSGKAREIKAAINQVEQIDKTEEPIEQKLRSARNILDKLSQENCFTEGKSRDAINKSIEIISCFMPEIKSQQHCLEWNKLKVHIHEDYSPPESPAFTG